MTFSLYNFKLFGIINITNEKRDRMFGKKKNDNKLDVSSINELVRVAKKVVDIFFILSIFILIFIIGRLLIDWGVLRAIKTILKILLPFFLGIIISWLLNPIVERLENKGWKRSISTFVVFFTFLILLALFFYIVIPSIGRQIQDAIGMVPKVLDNFRAWMNNFFDNLTNHYDYDFTTVKDNIYSAILPSKCFIVLPFTHVYNNCESVLVFGMRITCFFMWIYNYVAFFWAVSIEFVTILLVLCLGFLALKYVGSNQGWNPHPLRWNVKS